MTSHIPTTIHNSHDTSCRFSQSMYSYSFLDYTAIKSQVVLPIIKMVIIFYDWRYLNNPSRSTTLYIICDTYAIFFKSFSRITSHASNTNNYIQALDFHMHLIYNTHMYSMCFICICKYYHQGEIVWLNRF